MGTWGSGLFEDDLAIDIRSSFASAVESGTMPGSAAQIVLREYNESISDSDEAPVVYLSLASLLLDSGVCEHAAISRAARIIEDRVGLDRWREVGGTALAEREAVYQDLRSRIESNDKNKSGTLRRRVKLPKVGDFLQIPLSDGRYAYGQYVFHDDIKGPLLQVFDRFTSVPVDVEHVELAGPLFPPVVTYLNHAVRTGRWQIIGTRPVAKFTYPGFINGIEDSDGKINMWWLWDGLRETRLGPMLPDRYKSLEFQVLWTLDSVEERIRSGSDPYIDRLRRANGLD